MFKKYFDNLRATSRGFTLVELLVVISIIALLLSVLMPVLGKVRAEGRSIMCSNYIRQITLGLRLYSESNNGKLFSQAGAGSMWFDQIASFLGDSKYSSSKKYLQTVKDGPMKILFCPSTKKAALRDARKYRTGTATQTYIEAIQLTEASYGMNLFLTPNYGGYEYYPGSGNQIQRSYYYDNFISLKSGVPAFADAAYVGGWPVSSDLPPSNLQDADRVAPDGMPRFCLDRHRMSINVGFADGHNEKVPLKKLWTLQWHKGFAPNNDIVLPRK